MSVAAISVVAIFPVPHGILAILDERYESGLLLQDSTYATSSPLFRRYSESYASTDLIDVVPIRAGMNLQAGVKNLLDRNYCYTAGYPASSRSVTLWRYGIHVLTKFAA